MFFEAFEDLLSRIAARLQERGFARRGSVLFCERGGNFGLIDFQKSQKTSREAVVFTVNLGVVSGKLVRFFSPSKKVGPPARVSDWHWRERLGFLLAEGRDQWWSISAGTDVRRISQTLEDALIRLALPEIERYIGDESLRDLWLARRSPGLTELQRLRNLAVLLQAIGPGHELPLVMDELRKSSTTTANLIEKQFQLGASA